MEWLHKLNCAIEYIEQNLEREISYKKAAEIACCSASYFQRMFTYVAGVPLSCYIRRRRMTQAAFELQTTQHKVIEVALKYGYASPTAFTRAFQAVHGISPVTARRRGCRLHTYLPIRLQVTVTGDGAITYRMEETAAMRLVGIRIPLPGSVKENQALVPEFWERTRGSGAFEKICRLSDQAPYGVLGVTASPPCGEPCYFIAASTSGAAPRGMLELTIPAATWAVFEINGALPDSMQTTFRRFLREWLPLSGYHYAHLPDLEVYPARENDGKAGPFEVWIAVTKEKEDFFGHNCCE